MLIYSIGHSLKMTRRPDDQPILSAQANSQQPTLPTAVAQDEEKYGRHGDMKVENILCFSDPEVLVPANFGLGPFQRPLSRSMQDSTTINGSPSCAPPMQPCHSPNLGTFEYLSEDEKEEKKIDWALKTISLPERRDAHSTSVKLYQNWSSLPDRKPPENRRKIL